MMMQAPQASSQEPAFPRLRGRRRRRWAFRQAVVDTSASQRRTPTTSTSSAHWLSRPIVDTLYDRQCRGIRGAPVLSRLPPAQPTNHNNSEAAASQEELPLPDNNNTHPAKKRVARSTSPSTVCEAPPTTTTTATTSGTTTTTTALSPTNNTTSIPLHANKSVVAILSPDNVGEGSSSDAPATTAAYSLASAATSSPAAAGASPATKVTIGSVLAELVYFAEYSSNVHYHSAFLHHLGGNDATDAVSGLHNPVSSRAVSTISIAFAADGHTMASTHGDHTVKISCCHTGRLLTSLEGHARTPWTVKYHPVHCDIVASGCLGHQVRVWNWTQRVCLQMVRLEFAIISLTFHPSGRVLAVANGTRLHFWGLDVRNNDNEKGHTTQQNAAAPYGATATTATPTVLKEMDQRHMLRCVHFPPDGTTLIIGGVNPPSSTAVPTADDRRRASNAGGRPAGSSSGGMSFYLKLWQFDLDLALLTTGGSSKPMNQPHHAFDPIHSPRTFVPRALLYNDGGFDVSPDGKYVCACVEYWLPDGTDNAMDLVDKEQWLYDEQQNTKQQQHEAAVQEEQSSQPSEATPGRNASATAATTRTPAPPSTQGLSVLTNTKSKSVSPFLGVAPRTPEPSSASTAAALMQLSPPPPPGRRLVPTGHAADGTVVTSPPPLPPSSHHHHQMPSNSSNTATTVPAHRPPHPLSAITSTNHFETRRGRYVPHVVTLSLDTRPLDESILARIDRNHGGSSGEPPQQQQQPLLLPAVATGYHPRLGQLVQACPLEAGKATAVTCVKYSPSTRFCLIGYGVREPISPATMAAASEGGANGGGIPFHPVTAIYRIPDHSSHGQQQQRMTQISTMTSREDDVNIARFHPNSGHGFVYGTKQGRVRVVGTRPWMFYHEQQDDEDEEGGSGQQ